MRLPRACSTAVAGLILLALAAAGFAMTGASADPPANTVTVTGVGRVSVAPDTAVLTLGVTARATTVAEASTDTARRMSAVLAQVRSRGVADADITTVSYSVDPRMSVPRPEEPPRPIGYDVTNVAQVTVRKIADAGPILDAAMGAGANVVRGIQFTRADTAKAQAEARAAAVADAMLKVRQLAAAAGVQVGEVLAIRESPAARPIMRAQGMAASFAPTPLEAGELEIVVTIELRQAIRQ
jgi:uncharacterized protein YggE